jgi:hypothetical protein
MEWDKYNDRIPLREVFISTDLIIEAFEMQPNVRKVLQHIIDKLNHDSDGVFSLALSVGASDNELSVIDTNFTLTQQELKNSQLEGEYGEGDNVAFKDLFTFDIMSQKSIVKDYNLGFKMPSDNIGNMYAIMGMDHTSKIFPSTRQIDDAVALSAVDNESLSIVYEPDKGTFRSDEIAASANSNVIKVYKQAKSLLETDAYPVQAIRKTENFLPGPLERYEWNDEQFKIRTEDNETVDEEELFAAKWDRLMEHNAQQQEAMGMRVVSSFSEYFALRTTEKVLMDNMANILPYTLDLNIYGIASLVPGDTFRVDFLPKIHLDFTYAQTMRVTQKINSAGWFTTLHTQFRIRPEIKLGTYRPANISSTRLNVKALDQLKLRPFSFENPQHVSRNSLGHKEEWLNTVPGKGTFPGEMMGRQKGRKHSSVKEHKLSDLYPFMTGLSVVPPPIDDNGRSEYEHLDMVLFFTWKGKKSDFPPNDKMIDVSTKKHIGDIYDNPEEVIRVYFPQENFCNWSREQYFDWTGYTMAFGAELNALSEYALEPDSRDRNANQEPNQDDVYVGSENPWLNFPTEFRFGGYIHQRDFYDPGDDCFFDKGADYGSCGSSIGREEYGDHYVGSDYFNESVWARLMTHYAGARIDKLSNRIRDDRFYDGWPFVDLRYGQNYYLYINGDFWGIQELNDFREDFNASKIYLSSRDIDWEATKDDPNSGWVDNNAENRMQAVYERNNWRQWDKDVTPIILDAKQCTQLYWNQVFNGTYQIADERDSLTTNVDWTHTFGLYDWDHGQEASEFE